VLQALFRGMDINKQHTCSIIDLVPYDSSLPRAVMELTSSEAEGCPRMCACSVVWTGVDQERQAIHRYIYSDVRNVMHKLSMQGAYKVPGMRGKRSFPGQRLVSSIYHPTYIPTYLLQFSFCMLGWVGGWITLMLSAVVGT